MDPRIVIVGAGAAGIGAGLALQQLGIPFVILEASGRIGGRAHTDGSSLPVSWDRGCHWLHCADVNPLVQWADKLGATYDTRDRTNAFMLWTGGRFVDREALGDMRAATHAAFAAIDDAGAENRDIPVSDLLEDDGPWRKRVRGILTLMASEDPERVSTEGYSDYEDTGKDWPVLSGYGDLIRRMAEGLPIRTGTAVTRLEQRAGGVRLETSGGSIDAQKAIVTVSTNVLASGALTVSSTPARAVLDRISHVPCGAYEKVAIALDSLPFDDPEKRHCMVDAGGTGIPDNVVDFQIVRTRPPLMIAHMAGDLARGLAAAGEAAMTDFAVERLALAFGSDVRARIVATAVTGWDGDPHIRGAYSVAKPGKAAERHAMIAADTGDIAFAGEAFSRPWQATAHGAYQTGRDVALRLARECGDG